MHRFIQLRKEHPVFGLGTTSRSGPRTAHLRLIRRFEDDLVLCVHNLARSAQAVELDLTQFRGRYRWSCSATPASRPSASCLPTDLARRGSTGRAG